MTHGSVLPGAFEKRQLQLLLELTVYELEIAKSPSG
jgi:hypothetical protein